MQVDIMRDLALFEGEREEFVLVTAPCGCLWLAIMGLGFVPALVMYDEILEPCGKEE